MREVKVNGKTPKRSGLTRKEQLSGILDRIQSEYRRRKRKLQWQLLIAKNPRKAHYPNYKGQEYQGPEVAVNTLRHAKEVNEHYQALTPPDLSFKQGRKP